ncbi:alpha/beta hydrolase [Streptomyces spiralis]|uniref:alpha/beta hydrolase n=1 Tax=Streptomyces spiralis TaxID=66376 RepID=UPI0033CAAC77
MTLQQRARSSTGEHERRTMVSYPYDPEVDMVVSYAPPLDLTDIAAARELLAQATAGLPPFQPEAGVELTHLDASGAGDNPPVDLYMLRPSGGPTGQGRPALLWFHGGGFVLGDARESLPFLDAAVRLTGAIGISVQYSLAPEATFPAPIEEGLAALNWIVAHAEQLGVDPERIAVGGQSAGGAHAAGLALRLRDEGGPKIVFQLLDIPVTDDRLITQSAVEYTDGLVWNTKNAQLSWRAYLGDTGEPVSPYAAPARAEDLSGLPPAFITVNQFDPLRDEGIEYARRLAHAKVPAELHLYAGTFHGSSGIALAAEVSRRQNSDLVAALGRALAATVPVKDERN